MSTLATDTVAYVAEIWSLPKRLMFRAAPPPPPPSTATLLLQQTGAFLEAMIPGLNSDLAIFLFGIAATGLLFLALSGAFYCLQSCKRKTQIMQPQSAVGSPITLDVLVDAVTKTIEACHEKDLERPKPDYLTVKDMEPLLESLKAELLREMDAPFAAPENSLLKEDTLKSSINEGLQEVRDHMENTIRQVLGSHRKEMDATIQNAVQSLSATKAPVVASSVEAMKLSECESELASTREQLEITRQELAGFPSKSEIFAMDHELCSLWEANNSLLAAQAQQPSAGPAETDGSLICQLRTQLDTAKAEQEAAKTAARVEQEKSEEVRARHDEVLSEKDDHILQLETHLSATKSSLEEFQRERADLGDRHASSEAELKKRVDWAVTTEKYKHTETIQQLRRELAAYKEPTDQTTASHHPVSSPMAPRDGPANRGSRGSRNGRRNGPGNGRPNPPNRGSDRRSKAGAESKATFGQ